MRKLSLILAAVLVLSVLLPQVSILAADTDYKVSDKAFENFSMNVGADEGERNFLWHSNSTEGYVEFAVRDGDTFPEEYTSVQTYLSQFNGKLVHRATIFGLKSDTEYVYRLRSGNTVSKLRYFTTDPVDHFNFIFVGDPQMGSTSRDNNIANWKNTLSTALSMFPETSLLISAGDQVEESNDPSLFSAYLAPEQLTSLAMATSIGNHDYDSNFYKNYFNNPNTTIDGKSYGESKAGGDYWYTYNGVLFLHINTCNVNWDEHKEFMQKAIALNPDVSWKVVVTHYNFFGSNDYYINEAIRERREQFAPMMKELDIDVVLAGHEHVNSRAYMIDGLTPDTAQGNATSVTDPKGILYLSGGTPSGSKYYNLLSDAQLPHIAFKLQKTITFTNIEVNDHSFKITTYRVSDKAVLDTFEIKKDKNAVEQERENHVHTKAEWTDVYEPTYHFDGVRVKRCTSCGAAYEYEYVPKLEREEGNDNIALGKKYTHTGLFLDDGLEKYPDEDGTTMTDGRFAMDGIYNDPAFIGFHTSYGDYDTKGYFSITVDLEGVYPLEKFVAFTASSYATAGVTGPAAVAVYLSLDNKNWVHAGTTKAVDNTETKMLEITVEPETVSCARYVQYRFVASKAFVMVAEVEAYEAEVGAHTHVAGDWVEAQKPTEQSEGKSCKYCTLCGEAVETQAIPKLDPSSFGENLVLGMEYQRSPLYSSEGVDRYPDENGLSMTDGILGDDSSSYSSAEFMAFYAKNTDYLEQGYFHITFDLGEEYELWRFATYYAASSAKNKGAGVQEPSNISVYVSSNGTDWSCAGTVTPEEVNDKGMTSTAILLEEAVTARYVQFRYVHTNTFVMTSEAEVYGFPVGANVPDEPSDESSEDPSEESSEEPSEEPADSSAEPSVPADSSADNGEEGGSALLILAIVAAVAIVAVAAILVIKRKK